MRRLGSCGGEDELLYEAEWQRSSSLCLSCRAAGQEMKLRLPCLVHGRHHGTLLVTGRRM